MIFTAAGTIGQVGIIPSEAKFKRYVISNKQIRARLNAEIIDIDYAYYWFSSPWIRKILMNSNKGSTVPLLTLSEVKQLPISYPVDKTAQKKISGLLNAIYKKIELNNQIIAELEAMAKTLYDYWFLQFDFPDENGKPYRSSGGKMVYNEEVKREIPEGWEVVKIDSLIAVKDGTHDSPQYLKEGKYLITSKHLLPSGLDFSSANRISEEDFDSINKRSKVENGDILFSMIGAVGIVYRVNEQVIDFAIKNVALYKSSKLPYIQEYLEQTLTSALMDAYITQCNAGSIQKFVSLSQLRAMLIVYNEKILKLYSQQAGVYFNKIILLKRENREFISLRDFLLPMLMNGQVTFKDIKED